MPHTAVRTASKTPSQSSFLSNDVQHDDLNIQAFDLRDYTDVDFAYIVTALQIDISATCGSGQRFSTEILERQ